MNLAEFFQAISQHGISLWYEAEKLKAFVPGNTTILPPEKKID